MVTFATVIYHQYNGGWDSIALVGHSSRGLLDLYTKLAGQRKLAVLDDSSPRSLYIQNLKKGGGWSS